jgi:cyclic-di-GMP-binding protein
MNQSVVDLLNSEIPRRTRSQLSLISANRAEMQTWLANLSMLNVGETARQLFTTLKELADLDIEEALRYELMEVLRPALHTINASLSKHYVNQNVLLDERAERIADLGQQLRTYAATVYRTVALRAADQLSNQTYGLFSMGKKRAQILLIGNAIHRGMTELTGLLYETQLLYLPTYKGLWQRLHELFELSATLDLRLHPLADENQVYDKLLTIDQVYLRAIFLAVSNTNKLRQTEIKKIYQFSELWVPLTIISQRPSGHDLFLVDPTNDAPPMYITKYSELSPKTYYIDVRQLLSHFENLTSTEPQLLNRAEGSLLSGSLKYHLILTFTAPLERSYARHPYNGVLDISLGLIGSHFQLAEQKTFEEVIEQSATTALVDNNALRGLSFAGGADYDISYTPQDEQSRAEAMREYQDTYRCDIVNISPGGYCVRWSGKTPSVLRTGELITVREPTDKLWHVGLIRWVKQNPTEGAEFGLEILSPRGKSCGARVLRKDGENTEYMRTLLLPEMKNLNRPATMITPILAFKVGYRILIRLGREEVRAQLTRELMVTQSFSQFEFVILRKDTPRATPTTTERQPLSISKDDAYEEVWHTL